MGGKLIEFDKAEEMLKKRGEEKKPDIMKSRLSFVDRATDLVIEEASVKQRLAESVITKYNEAIAGERDIEPLQDHLADFMNVPVSTILTSERTTIPIMVDSINGMEHVAGITRLEKKEGSPLARFAAHIVREIEPGTWEKYSGEGKWEVTDSVIPVITKEESEILKKGDAESELLRLLISTSPDGETHEKIMERFEKNKPLAKIRASLQGMTAFTALPDKKIAIVPLDWGHTGIALTTEGDKYEIRQCIAGGYRKEMHIHGSEKSKEKTLTPVVAKTKRKDVAEKVFLNHIEARKGLEQAITVPLSITKHVCITGNTAEELLSTFLEKINETDGLTTQEKESAETFANCLANL